MPTLIPLFGSFDDYSSEDTFIFDNSCNQSRKNFCHFLEPKKIKIDFPEKDIRIKLFYDL
jgi:hypothetical protein